MGMQKMGASLSLTKWKPHTALTTCPSEFCKQLSYKQAFDQLCASPVMPTGCCWLFSKPQSLYLSRASSLLMLFYLASESVFCFHRVSLMRGYKCLLTSLNESCQTTQKIIRIGLQWLSSTTLCQINYHLKDNSPKNGSVHL